jgi:hypothetical protein
MTFCFNNFVVFLAHSSCFKTYFPTNDYFLDHQINSMHNFSYIYNNHFNLNSIEIKLMIVSFSNQFIILLNLLIL